jgi:hypothetical protein
VISCMTCLWFTMTCLSTLHVIHGLTERDHILYIFYMPRMNRTCYPMTFPSMYFLFSVRIVHGWHTVHTVTWYVTVHTHIFGTSDECMVINHLFCNNTQAVKKRKSRNKCKYHLVPISHWIMIEKQKLTNESASHFQTTVSGLISSLDLSVS